MVKIIAELCQNHAGSSDILWRSLDAAASAGATHVKLQTIYARDLTKRPEFEEGVKEGVATLAIRRPYADEHERLSRLELAPHVYEEFVCRAQSLGVVPMTTCFTRGQVATVADQGFQAVKIASYDCASFQLLREVRETFSSLFVSTGATYDDEVALAASILEGHADWTMLHCVTLYPTPLEETHLARIGYLKTLASQVGLSDHSSPSQTGLIASKMALALGSDAIERHFTILPSDETRDGPISIGVVEMQELVRFANLDIADQQAELAEFSGEASLVMGSSQRRLSESELLNRNYYRGRFATPRSGQFDAQRSPIFNWEEVSLP